MHSILSEEPKCYICGSARWLEVHHIFNGANRNNSTKYGLVVYLCHYCHNEPPNGIHYNAVNKKWLQQKGQIAFEKQYPNLDFIKIFHKNYKE